MMAMTKDFAVSVRADVRRELRDHAIKPAGCAGERRANAEGNRIEDARINTVEPRRREILSRGANGATERRRVQHPPERPGQQKSNGKGCEPDQRDGKAINCHVRAGIDRVDGAKIGAENQLSEIGNDDIKAEGDEQGVE